VLREWPPEEVHGLASDFFLLVNSVQSCKKHSFKSKISKQPSICARVAKSIDMPSYSGGDSKLTLQELVAHQHVVNNVLVVSAGLIGGTPAAICELQSSFFDQFFYIILHLFCLSPVPHGEEFHLHVGKSALRVLQKLINRCLKDQVYDCVLGILLCA